MGDYFDVRVHDLVALDEIELYAEVLSAVAVGGAAADRRPSWTRCWACSPWPPHPRNRALRPRRTPARLDGAHDHDRFSAIYGGKSVTISADGGDHSAGGSLVNMTSVSQRVKPSDSYSLIAGGLSPST